MKKHYRNQRLTYFMQRLYRKGYWVGDIIRKSKHDLSYQTNRVGKQLYTLYKAAIEHGLIRELNGEYSFVNHISKEYEILSFDLGDLEATLKPKQYKPEVIEKVKDIEKDLNIKVNGYGKCRRKIKYEMTQKEIYLLEANIKKQLPRIPPYLLDSYNLMWSSSPKLHYEANPNVEIRKTKSGKYLAIKTGIRGYSGFNSIPKAANVFSHDHRDSYLKRKDFQDSSYDLKASVPNLLNCFAHNDHNLYHSDIREQTLKIVKSKFPSFQCNDVKEVLGFYNELKSDMTHKAITFKSVLLAMCFETTAKKAWNDHKMRTRIYGGATFFNLYTGNWQKKYLENTAIPSDVFECIFNTFWSLVLGNKFKGRVTFDTTVFYHETEVMLRLSKKIKDQFNRYNILCCDEVFYKGDPIDDLIIDGLVEDSIRETIDRIANKKNITIGFIGSVTVILPIQLKLNYNNYKVKYFDNSVDYYNYLDSSKLKQFKKDIYTKVFPPSPQHSSPSPHGSLICDFNNKVSTAESLSIRELARLCKISRSLVFKLIKNGMGKEKIKEKYLSNP
jgi:hypothetical protein